MWVLSFTITKDSFAKSGSFTDVCTLGWGEHKLASPPSPAAPTNVCKISQLCRIFSLFCKMWLSNLVKLWTFTVGALSSFVHRFSLSRQNPKFEETEEIYLKNCRHRKIITKQLSWIKHCLFSWKFLERLQSVLVYSCSRVPGICFSLIASLKRFSSPYMLTNGLDFF